MKRSTRPRRPPGQSSIGYWPWPDSFFHLCFSPRRRFADFLPGR
jgi:hypothetical protein